MNKITLTTELLNAFLKFGGHIVFTNDAGIPRVRANVGSFNLQDGKLSVKITGVEINRMGRQPKWEKSPSTSPDLEINLGVYSTTLQDYSGIYLASENTSTFKFVSVTII